MTKELDGPVWLRPGLPDCYPLSFLLLDDGSSLSSCSDSRARVVLTVHGDRVYSGEFATHLGRRYLWNFQVADASRKSGEVYVEQSNRKAMAGLTYAHVKARARPSRGQEKAAKQRTWLVGSVFLPLEALTASSRGNRRTDYACNSNSNYCGRKLPRPRETCSTADPRLAAPITIL